MRHSGGRALRVAAGAALLLLRAAPLLAEDAEPSYRAAVEAGAAGDLPGARRLLVAALDQDPQHVASRRALELLADQAQGRVAYGVATLLLEGIRLQARGAWSQAEAQYRQAVEREPDYYYALHNLATACYERGKNEEAIALYTKALEANPDYPYTHNNLGLALARGGDHERAVAAYRQALALDPSYHKAYNNLGASLSVLGREQEAQEAFREALRLKPDYVTAESNLSAAGSSLASPEPAGPVEPPLPALVLLLESRRAEDRARAARMLGRRGNASALDALLPALRDREWAVRFEVVLALARIGDERAAESLATAVVKDRDPHVRRAAAQALVAYPTCEAAGALRRAERDRISEVRLAAASSLSWLCGEATSEDSDRPPDACIAAVCAEGATERP